ncbi:MAG: porphobilinogen synthase [Verrucomicrobiales bacterium]|nr:porphobilinogen synthase [Verrucomicrobiales bacterium]
MNLLKRPRRLRSSSAIRDLVQEARVEITDLIAPLFVKADDGAPVPIESMPNQFRFSITDLVQECKELCDAGVRGVALFPVTPDEKKDPLGKESTNPDGLGPRALRAINGEVPDLLLFADIALDPFTSHGHDGILTEDGSDVVNDATVETLTKMAIVHAEAGAHFVAPSDMMDGRVGAIRKALDSKGLNQTGILAYSAKFASAYYGPFRDAVGSASAAGTRSLDKRSYQLNPANRREAIRDALLDEGEGADMLMVKPGGPYLDIIRDLREASSLPIAAYQVSGEYAQIHATAKLGWLDYEKTRNESLLSLKRAGADVILTYFAKELANA